MPTRAERICVIHDGGLPALVACLMADDPGQVVAWCPPVGSRWEAAGIGGDEEITPIHRRAAERQGELLGLARVSFAEPRSAANIHPAGPALEATAMLLAAAMEAVAEGCTALIWPICCGGDLGALAAAAEKASLISRLVQLDLHTSRLPRPPAGAPELSVETPFADLTPGQIAELALDLDAPAHACWWRLPGAEQTPGGREARAAWHGALRAASRAMGFPFAVPAGEAA